MLESKEELVHEIEQRYETQGLGWLDKNGTRHSLVGSVGQAMYGAIRASEKPVETTEESDGSTT